MPSPKILTFALILSCALLGGYAGIFLSFHHGFFDALRICTSSLPVSQEKCILNMPHVAHIPSYTNIPFIDSHLAILFEFFAQGLTVPTPGNGFDLQAVLAMSYLAAQFGGAWYLLALEGLRKGNIGTILSHTGMIGLAFQVLTITIIGPIYLMIHLFLYQNHYRNNITIELSDLRFLPISFTLTFIVPTIGLVLPLLDLLSPAGKYLVIALWQPFPLYQSALHSMFRYGTRRKKNRDLRTDPSAYKRSLGRAYKFILLLTVGVHTLVLGAITTTHVTRYFPKVSAADVLMPDSLADPATLSLLEPPVSGTAAQSIVVSFLRWDVYCCCAALVIWAAYLSCSAQKSGNMLDVFVKIVLWTLVGGPVTPAVILLWQRDIVVMEAVDYWAFTKTE